MKLLFAIAEHHPTFRADVNVLFGKYLPRLGVHSDLLTLHSTEDAPPPWSGGGLHTISSSTRRLWKHIRSIANDMRMLSLGANEYDAIQVRDKALAALIGLVAARRHNIQFYYWMSFPIAEAWSAFARERGLSVGLLRLSLAWLRGKAMFFLLYRIVLPRANHVFVQSDSMREELIAKGMKPDRLTAVPMGIDDEEAASLQAAHSPDTIFFDRPTFVYLGALARSRSPDLMLEAIDIVRQKVPDAQLLLIGDSDEADDRIWLNNLIKMRNLSANVQTTGWLPITEGWALAKRCLAGLSPYPRGTLWDVGTPTKAIEYFGLGLPVIANDQPDQSVVLAGAGASCVALTAAAFAERMLDVIANPERYRAQARAGQYWVRSHRNYAVLAAKVAAVYRDVTVVKLAKSAAG